MEYIFCIAMAILQQARIDLLRLDMEGMLKVRYHYFNLLSMNYPFILVKVLGKGTSADEYSQRSKIK